MTADATKDNRPGRVTSAVATYRQTVWKAWSQRRLRAQTVDRVLASGLAAWALFDVPWWWRPPGHSGSTMAILGVLGLATAQSLPFLWRRRQPAGVLVLAGACLAVKYATHLNIWSASAAVLAAAYGLGGYGGRPARITARLLAGAAVVAALVSLQVSGGNHTAAVACALLATALVMGEVTSAHRDAATAAARHAHEMERASLAREIHDVVAHQLSAIAVQAGAARLASAADLRAAADAVAAIEQEARSGLAELNKLVKGLRQAGGAGQDASPRLQDIPGLIERARESGLRAELVVDGEPRVLADPVELAGYRVVQESLTNAIRYAAGTAATVRLAYRDGGIIIEVTDDGPGALPSSQPRPGGGVGLAGLSERACLLGGELEAGSSEKGFVVRAFLPSLP
jgi:signal transduction histidine kinase